MPVATLIGCMLQVPASKDVKGTLSAAGRRTGLVMIIQEHMRL